MIGGECGNPDKLEHTLLLSLIKQVLNPDLNGNTDDIRTCAKLSESLRSLDPTLGYTTINIVLNKLITLNQYADAYVELKRPECSECRSRMEQIEIMDKGHLDIPSRHMEYRAMDGKKSWAGIYKATGVVESYMCTSCGRILLYGKKVK